MAQSSAWRGRETDITGFHNIGLRPYDPVSGRWLAFDPAWNSGDPDGYTFCAGGDPVNYFDPDGRFGKVALENAMVPTSVRMAMGMANQGIADYKMGGGGVMGSLTAINRYNPATPFYNLAGQRDILSGKDFTWWGDYSENIGQAGLTVLTGGIMGKTLLAGQADRMAADATSSLWQNRFPGVQVRQVGNYWVKRANPDSSSLMQAWGQNTIQAQADALAKLRAAGVNAANSRLFDSGRLVVEDVGPTLSRWNYLNPKYWQSVYRDSRALGTPNRT